MAMKTKTKVAKRAVAGATSKNIAITVSPKLHKGLCNIARKAGFTGKTGWQDYALSNLKATVGL